MYWGLAKIESFGLDPAYRRQVGVLLFVLLFGESKSITIPIAIGADDLISRFLFFATTENVIANIANPINRFARFTILFIKINPYRKGV